jgi:hypothetical protein
VLNHWEERAGVFVANGVTGIRELGNASLDSLRAVRARNRLSTAAMPRLIASAVLIDGSPPVRPNGSVVLDRAENASRLVDSLVDSGVDFLKTYARIKPEPFFALTREAARRHLAVAGHVPTALAPIDISDAGMRAIEHIFEFPLACSSRERDMRAQRVALEGNSALPAVRVALGDTVFRTFDAEKCRRIAAHLAKNGTFVTPTLYLWKRGGPQLPPSARDSALSRYFAEGLAREWPPAVPEFRLSPERTKAFYDLLASITGEMHRAGVPLLIGTDTHARFLWPGFSVHDEMRTLVEDAGMSTAAVLRAATFNVARYFAATDSMGTVARGRVADLVLLDRNPLDDIRNTERITAVVLRGRFLDRPALDALLSDAARGARR